LCIIFKRIYIAGIVIYGAITIHPETISLAVAQYGVCDVDGRITAAASYNNVTGTASEELFSAAILNNYPVKHILRICGLPHVDTVPPAGLFGGSGENNRFIFSTIGYQAALFVQFNITAVFKFDRASGINGQRNAVGDLNAVAAINSVVCVKVLPRDVIIIDFIPLRTKI